ncbi:hypothetical protein ScPMuIL_002546, partial [Solemya velum]
METKVIFSRKKNKRNGYVTENLENVEDWEGDSDEEDVLVEDPVIDQSSATKPLMHPRQRARVKSRRPDCNCRLFIRPLMIFIVIVITLGALMLLILYFLDKYRAIDSAKQNTIHIAHTVSTDGMPVEVTRVVGCDHMEVEDVWVMGFPKLLTESAFRLLDVNQDGSLDVILGFATGADGFRVPKVVCDIYFNGTYPCFGGLLALDGMTGRELWRHYSQHELYGITCNSDLNGDGVHDCLGGGRAGTFQAVNGRDGNTLWTFDDPVARNEIMNLYTAQVIRDLDGDDVTDILAIHGGDPLQDPGSAFRLSGRLLLLSGRTGAVLRWVTVPDERESYYSPQIYTHPDGTDVVLFGTGGETHPGGLWAISLDDLYKGNIDQATSIFKDGYKGVMTPPVLIDMTGDGVDDIVIPMFNSTVVAFDGLTYKQLWNHTLPMSESYNTPSPGYYNDDEVPDFMIKFAKGPGFPVYFHSETTILDGKTGKPLLDPPVRDTIGAQASPLTISVEGYGNDIFLYWIADCLQHDGEGGQYSFVEGTNVHEQSRSDFCRLRFKTHGYSKVYAISRHMKQPGATIYYSDSRKDEEHNDWVNTTKEAMQFLERNPEYINEYRDFEESPPFDKPSETLLSPFDSANEEYMLPTQYDYGNDMSTYKKGPFQGNSGTGRFTLPRTGLDDDPNNIQIDRDLYSKLQNVLGDIIGSESPTETESPNIFDSPYQYYPPTNRYPPLFPPGNIKQQTNDMNRRYQQNNRPRNTLPQPMLTGRRKRQTNNRKGHANGVLDDNAHSYTDIFDMFKKLLSVKTNRLAKNNRKKVIERNTRLKRSPRRKTKRKRRHIGPHDEEGLQRLLSTGTLAPTTLDPHHPNYNHSIDFIFATYWFFPAKTEVLLPEDQACLEEKMKEETIRFDRNSKYYGLDHDSYKHAVTHECAGDHDLPDEGTYESQTNYNPFNIHMGQMTVY